MAIIPPPEIIDAIKQSIAPLQILPVRFLAEEMWHVTLHFLGYTDEADIHELNAIARQCVENIPAFEIALSDLSWGPSDNTPRMIWLNLDVSKEYLDLVRCLRVKLKTAQKTGRLPQFVLKKEQFGEKIHSHITLARFK